MYKSKHPFETPHSPSVNRYISIEIPFPKANYPSAIYKLNLKGTCFKCQQETIKIFKCQMV